jgi:hypothetical protein
MLLGYEGKRPQKENTMHETRHFWTKMADLASVVEPAILVGALETAKAVCETEGYDSLHNMIHLAVGVEIPLVIDNRADVLRRNWKPADRLLYIFRPALDNSGFALCTVALSRTEQCDWHVWANSRKYLNPIDHHRVDHIVLVPMEA